MSKRAAQFWQTYWSMLGSGDFELMAPFFNFYSSNLPLLMERTRHYWGHEGVVFPENLSIFGLFAQYWYGCDQRVGAPGGAAPFPKPIWFVECAYLRYHYNSGIEVACLPVQCVQHGCSACCCHAQPHTHTRFR